MFNVQILSKIGISIDDINFINDLAYNAGQIAKQRFEAGLVKISTKDEPDDFVTEVDKELNLLITTSIKEHFPEHSIISEEEIPHKNITNNNTTWVIDPIDGTSNYIANDGKYSVMIGLLKEGLPLAGWVYSPFEDRLILGIPEDGIYERVAQKGMTKKIPNNLSNKADHTIKIMMGKRDRKQNPAIKEKLSDLIFVESGSIGIKVIEIIETKADIFIHTSKKIKLWDTVAPSAIAIAGNLHLSTIENEPFLFSVNELQHTQTYAVGRKWALDIVVSKIKNLL